MAYIDTYTVKVDLIPEGDFSKKELKDWLRRGVIRAFSDFSIVEEGPNRVTLQLDGPPVEEPKAERIAEEMEYVIKKTIYADKFSEYSLSYIERMKDSSLRSSLIKLAYENKELREDILPLLQEKEDVQKKTAGPNLEASLITDGEDSVSVPFYEAHKHRRSLRFKEAKKSMSSVKNLGKKIQSKIMDMYTVKANLEPASGLSKMDIRERLLNQSFGAFSNFHVIKEHSDMLILKYVGGSMDRGEAQGMARELNKRIQNSVQSGILSKYSQAYIEKMKGASTSGLEKSLIKLGSENPALQKHIRPVIDRIKVARSKEIGNVIANTRGITVSSIMKQTVRGLLLQHVNTLQDYYQINAGIERLGTYHGRVKAQGRGFDFSTELYVQDGQVEVEAEIAGEQISKAISYEEPTHLVFSPLYAAIEDS